MKVCQTKAGKVWFCSQSLTTSTIGYDRSLICYNFADKSVHFNMPSFAGRVTCMAPNSVDPSILAFGSGDGLIKVWKTASSKSMFEYTTTWQKGFRGKDDYFSIKFETID